MNETPTTKFLSLLRNPVSYLGLSVTVLSAGLGIPLMLLDMLSASGNAYLGMMIYMVLPGTGVGGAALAGMGMWWEHYRRTHGGQTLPLPRLDLNDARDRVIAVGALALAVVVAATLSVAGYRAYHFTESVTFCGKLCHEVMKPEHTAYQYSAHARVPCVSCHVGEGAGWFVRSKLSGLYQVYSVTFNKFSRPIKTPVHSLRPAQDTCEKCHWPAKFFGGLQKVFTHRISDEKNSPWQVQMLLKVGGGDPETGAAGGIHWHMNIKNKVYYVSDESREVIPWVRLVGPDGKVTEYTTTEDPPKPEEIAKMPLRLMDCVDCHNRPSHVYKPADRVVDGAFELGQLDPSLPFLKRESVRLLAASYATQTEALAAIRKGLPEFYAKNYPKVLEAKRPAVDAAAETVARLFSSYIFPEMKTDWRVHPNHAGHRDSDGCYRCHDGLHKSADGAVVTKSCDACHSVLAQGPPQDVARARLATQQFKHPVEGVDVVEMKCSMCHNGAPGL
ncbi:MAG: NapC/NirT family cytochrome c [Elusimicrobia bacterium]|nr:NapC/NirT family cytochrome c [Elusimicrobiota bacterium]